MFRFKYPQIEKPDPEVEIEGVITPIKFLKDKSVTIEQYKTMRGNSAAWRALFPKYNDECLKHVTQHYVNNSQRDEGITYDQAIIHCIVPELLARLEEGRGHQ